MCVLAPFGRDVHEVQVVGMRPLGKRVAFEEGVQDFLFHLRYGVAVEHLDGQLMVLQFVKVL